MWSAPSVGQGFSPLDETLGLLPSPYSPFIVETIVRLATRLPFAQAAQEVADTLGVTVSADTVRELNETAGGVLERIEQRELERLEREAPPELPGPAVQQLSADGAMVPLVGGQWAEVRTLVIGEVRPQEDGEIHTGTLSYFSRLTSAEQFIRLATLPTYERGTRSAETVVTVMDGASWLQTLIDEQCPDAVRIIDFPHVVEYLTRAAHAAFGAESEEAAAWLAEWKPVLKTKTPEEVVSALRALPTPTPEATKAKRAAIRYLSSRLEQVRYADYHQKGYPIGSGMAESACKLVVEARLKGSGMHWATHNVNPLLALRGRVCSGQWDETWSGIWEAWRAEVRQAKRERRERHRALRLVREAAREQREAPPTPKPERRKTIVDGKPTADHPWNQGRGQRAA